MKDLLNHLDFWLTIFALGACAYFLLWKDHIQPFLRGFLPPASDEEEESPVERRRRARVRSRPLRGQLGQFAGSLPARNEAEIDRNEAESHFGAVSGVATPNDDAETISFQVLAKLVRAGVVTETQALESTFEVKAGSSKAYQEARAKLKRALEEEREKGAPPATAAQRGL